MEIYIHKAICCEPIMELIAEEKELCEKIRTNKCLIKKATTELSQEIYESENRIRTLKSQRGKILQEANPAALYEFAAF